MTIENQIESLLFWKNETVTTSWLAKTLGKTDEEIASAISSLSQSLEGRGLILQKNGNEVVLKTHPDASQLIETLSKEEMVKELTPSSLETLSIIIYRGPIAKKEIDYIRGVNSGFILRNLLIRGLIQKEEAKEGRGILYSPTLDLLSLLGISKLEDLEEYELIKKEIENFNASDK
ncbi:MAG: SMC-Scp complex subunit ScpB [Candidatus Paceibacterota bacterium]|jgi:segregation and condensation protein B